MSVAESLAALPEAEQRKVLADLTEHEAENLEYDWNFWGRPKQLPPKGDWITWLILAGRGFGKTRAGSEWVKSIACGKTPLQAGTHSRIAIIAETAADARDVLVEGESGLLAIHPNDFRPAYEPSKRRLTWPNGAIATLYNAVEPDQLRGPQHDAALCDELAKWKYARETWDMLQFGLRTGQPKQMVTTTPRPIPILKELIAADSTIVTTGSTYENRTNLAPEFFKTIVVRYEGTRLGRQELEAEILDDLPGALWQRAWFDQHRKGKAPDLQRIVVAVDPSGTKGSEEADDVGIVVAAKGVDGRGYVLADYTCNMSPDGWGKRAVHAYDKHDADLIIAEINYGGAMVEHVIKTVDSRPRYKEVRASRGKVVRAEPVAALYEQGRISHVGTFPELEDELCLFGPDGYVGEQSPNRADALVWALTELFLDYSETGAIRLNL